MIVYRYKYDESFGKNIFRDEYYCQEDPESLGTYLQPKDSTNIKPEIREGMVPYWEDEQWKYVEDFRIGKYYDKNTGSEVSCSNLEELKTLISEKPEYLFSTYSEDDKKWEINYSLVKKFFKDMIDNIIDKYTNDNISVSLKNKTIIVNYNEDSIKNIERLLNYITTSKMENIKFKTYNNEIIELNKEELKSIYIKMMDYNQELINKRWEIKEFIDKINSETDVINFSKLYNVNIYSQN